MAFRSLLSRSLQFNSLFKSRCLPITQQNFQQPCLKIHTTPPRQALPAIVILVMRPIMRVSAALFGRSIRKWWQKLPPDKKQKILSKIKGQTTYIAGASTVLVGIGGIIYLEHIEENPITRRKRFILYNEQQMNEIANLEFENQIAENKRDIIPPSHPVYRRIVRISNRILQANNNLEQIQGKTWAVTVVDRPHVTNAFVLPNGKIFVFTGILHVASNDDQLAVVLSHEISHTLMQHTAETLSKTFVQDVILLIPLVVIWALLPDVAALFSQWLTSRLAEITSQLPLSRALEKEADVVGLELAARACFDVREAPVFWGKMRQMELANSDEPLEWLSTHPNHETRQTELSHMVPAALQVRELCQCPRLPGPSIAQRYFYKV